jgi:hypothetical protein
MLHHTQEVLSKIFIVNYPFMNQMNHQIAAKNQILKHRHIIFKKNIKMIEDFLAVIRVKVEVDKRHSNRDDFNFEQM